MPSPDETSAVEMIRRHLLDDHALVENYSVPSFSISTSYTSFLTSQPRDSELNYMNFDSGKIESREFDRSGFEFEIKPTPICSWKLGSFSERKPSLDISIPPAKKAERWASEGSSLLAMKAGDSGDKRHYRGVRQRPWGKFVAEIRNPNRIGSRVWLGTYDSTVEAAKAYDRAAFRLRGRKAILNFPLEIDKNCSEPGQLTEFCGKRYREPRIEERERTKAVKKERRRGRTAARRAVSACPLTPSSWMAVWDCRNVKGIFEIPPLSRLEFRKLTVTCNNSGLGWDDDGVY